MAPVAACYAVAFIAYIPLLLLISRVRVGHIQACIARASLVLLHVCVLYAWAFSQRLAPIYAYALSLHFACFFLTLGAPVYPPLIGADADQVLRAAVVAVGLLVCWRDGPPLPIVDITPGLRSMMGGCGTQAHLLGIFYARVLCPFELSMMERLLVMGGRDSMH